MRSAKVSELKASISEYLSKVKAGEEVMVTDRGKPIAKIVPLKRGDVKIPAHLLMLERAGLAHIGSGRLPTRFWGLSRPKDKKGLALNALLMERAQGR